MFTRTLRCMTLCLMPALAISQIGCASATGARDGVFVHIKSGPEHPHEVLMGLRMAQVMADDRDVLVYVDVAGINAITEGAPDLKMEPFGSSHTMIADLIRREVPVYACPGCLKALGQSPEHLLPGIQVAEKQAFFAFTKGRILTLDY